MAIQSSQAVVEDLGTQDAFASLGSRMIKGKGKMVTYLYKACPSSLHELCVLILHRAAHAASSAVRQVLLSI